MLRGAALVYKAGLAGGLALWVTSLALAETAPAVPDFQEVYGLIRAHLPEVTTAELDRAAVQGIFSNMADKVAFVPGRSDGAASALSRTNIFEDSVGYVRVASVSADLPESLRQAWTFLTATNRLKGLVIDLRYAGGDDYASAGKTASLFVKKQEPLLDYGRGMVDSQPDAERIGTPIAVLVNGSTTSAAEALAGILRVTGVGLILGSRTAGKAMMYAEYPLKSGGELRILRGPVRLGDGKELESGAVVPDIAVEVGAGEERAYFADAFRASTNVSPAAGPTGRRVRYGEAELARDRREGGSGEAAATRARRAEPERPAVSDPALARALDLLKGLAVVRKQP